MLAWSDLELITLVVCPLRLPIAVRFDSKWTPPTCARFAPPPTAASPWATTGLKRRSPRCSAGAWRDCASATRRKFLLRGQTTNSNFYSIQILKFLSGLSPKVVPRRLLDSSLRHFEGFQTPPRPSS